MLQPLCNGLYPANIQSQTVEHGFWCSAEPAPFQILAISGNNGRRFADQGIRHDKQGFILLIGA
ncbi:hypothetical protein D3C75_1335110 [compost metagenome]